MMAYLARRGFGMKEQCGGLKRLGSFLGKIGNVVDFEETKRA